MFILTLEWFGLPDERKRHGIQLEYGFKGMSNDELRQAWMGEVVPFMDEVGLARARALRRGRQRWVDRLPVPRRRSTPSAKRWLRDDGTITWDEVMTRWKGRGPMNETYVERCSAGTAGWRRSRHECTVEARLWQRAAATSRTPRSPSPSSAWG